MANREINSECDDDDPEHDERSKQTNQLKYDQIQVLIIFNPAPVSRCAIIINQSN